MDNRKLKKFLSLPVELDDTWQGGFIPMADLLGFAAIDGAKEAGIIIWYSTLTGLVHAGSVLPTGEGRLEGFVEVMLEFQKEHKCTSRPAQIECNDKELAADLGDLLQDSGTNVTYEADMSEWDDVLKELAEQSGMTMPMVPSLREAGCSDEQISEFAQAAAAFYRAAPWAYLDDVDLVKIESPKPPRYLKYAVVLGAAAQTYGLGLYNKADDHHKIMSHEGDPRKITLFSMTFDSPADVASGDVELWKELDLPLETGEAFPSMIKLSKKGPERPKPKELKFVSILLKALAETSEEEIDSGRWSKSVEFLGKTEECVLSIPTLLDPPDRAEWMRRGLMPEMRGNEHHMKLVQDFIEKNGADMSLDELNAAINEKFSGPMDEIDYHADEPTNKAEALCQEAMETFGRRRIILAKQALAEDPNHVEANILLAESTGHVDRRIDLFRNAKEIAKKQLGPMITEDVGHFWGMLETRPFMRACHGLAASLDNAGLTNEAIEQYQEMLHLNPNDNQGVRYEVIPLLISHNREAEAMKLLDRYSEDTGHWHYMNALAVFRGSGRSVRSKSALRAAFRANKHVVELLQSHTPPFYPDSYSLGSPEEAAICINELVGVWSETEGFMPWMFSEYEAWQKQKGKKLRQRKQNQRKKKRSRK